MRLRALQLSHRTVPICALSPTILAKCIMDIIPWHQLRRVKARKIRMADQTCNTFQI